MNSFIIACKRLQRKVMGPNVKLNPLGILLICAAVIGSLVYLFGMPTSWFSSPAPISMKQLLGVSIYLAQKGGVEVVSVYEADSLKAVSKGKTKEGKDELKTQGDMKSHTAIMLGFKEAFPDLRVVSEEHGEVKVDMNINMDQQILGYSNLLGVDVPDEFVPINDLAVWIDPLDATQEYSEGNKTLLKYVTVMVCVVRAGKPVMGIIHQPFKGNDATNRTYWAWVGHGQSKNLDVKHDVKKPDKQIYNFIVSRSHAGDVEKAAQEAFPNQAKVKLAGGAGYKTLEVMRGESDAYIHTTLIKKWDICAGNAIIRHKGGRMTTMKGGDIDYSPDSNPKNPDGLLVSMTEESQKKFRSKLQPIFESMKSKAVSKKIT